MKIYFLKIFAVILILCLEFAPTWGQNGVNSPMTRYGYGQLSDHNTLINKGMGGVGIGLRDETQINVMNPASYTAVDSLTFLFEAGVSLQNANFSDGTTKLNAKNSSFDYLAMQFRLFKGMGMTLGFLPFSNVGYSFTSTEKIPAQSNWDSDVMATNTFSGNGGLHQVFVGAGYRLLPNFSVGANVAYLFGNFSHHVAASFSDANIYGLSRKYYAQVSDVTFDMGAQYTQRLSQKDNLTLGVTYSLGKDLHAVSAYRTDLKLNNGVAMDSDTTHFENAFQLPHAFGVGLTYNRGERLIVGADFLLQKYGDVRFFDKDGQLADRMKCSVGAQWLPNPMGNNLFKQMKYRIGAYYSRPYVKVNGHEAAKEYGLSIGLACPVSTWGWRTQRSIISLSGEWVRVEPELKGVLTENYLRVNIGLTFNERWFMKQKVR